MTTAHASRVTSMVFSCRCGSLESGALARTMLILAAAGTVVCAGCGSENGDTTGPAPASTTTRANENYDPDVVCTDFEHVHDSLVRDIRDGSPFWIAESTLKPEPGKENIFYYLGVLGRGSGSGVAMFFMSKALPSEPARLIDSFHDVTEFNSDSQRVAEACAEEGNPIFISLLPTPPR